MASLARRPPQYYFLNDAAKLIVSYDVPTDTWGSIEAAEVATMTSGVSMAAVRDTGAGVDYLVVSGGGSNRVMAYSIQGKAWKPQKPLLHSISNSCSLGCRGLFYTMTGDFKKDDSSAAPAAVRSGKPSDRQIYAYNLTSGLVFANNGEKTRGGAGCACGEKAGVVFFAGGFSDAGVSDQVEVWRYPLARRGEPKLSMGDPKRDVGGFGCGGMAIFAGGDDGKALSIHVEVWSASFNVSIPSTLSPKKYTLSTALRAPRVGCLAGRYAVISGGAGAKGCSSTVHLLDTANPPANGAALPVIGTLNGTGTVAVASSLTGTSIGFFDGGVLDLYEVASL